MGAAEDLKIKQTYDRLLLQKQLFYLQSAPEKAIKKNDDFLPRLW